MGVISVKKVRYNYGKFIVANIGGTNLTPEDWERINNTIEDEVSALMDQHDESVHDTHNQPSSDPNEYPDVTIFD